MRLTLFTDYALRILMFLASRPNELSTIREIAERYKISENHLMKIAHQLGKYGFVETVRGRQGGLRLALKPEAVNIGDVVRRYEEDLRLVECFDAKTNTCPIAGACALTGVIGDALESFLSTLDKKTLADIMAQSPKLKRKLS